MFLSIWNGWVPNVSTLAFFALQLANLILFLSYLTAGCNLLNAKRKLSLCELLPIWLAYQFWDIGWTWDIGREHVNLFDEQLSKLLDTWQLDQKELDR